MTQKKSSPRKNKKADAKPSSKSKKKDSPAIQPSFPIVGIGASAGGLEALTDFFKAMPENPGIAFVVVVHLDPKHISILPELLQKQTKMKVQQVEDGISVEPDHIYIIPPNREMTILNGTIQLMDLSQPRGLNLPIDSFLHSLAQDQQSNASCIILSGTGSDGTRGVRSIKSELGMVMVQDPESAKYDGMPLSVVATGLADYILPPNKMPEQLIEYISHAVHHDKIKVPTEEGETPLALQKIYVILRARVGHDFSLYKKNTICRRIERRMNVHQLEDISQYVRYLKESDCEADILFNELLIGVTNFFRDPEAFKILQEEYLPQLLEDKPDDYTIRVWIPGCSTGEEAYSIAILLHECIEKLGRPFHFQIFATDIDQEAITIARAGRFPESITKDVSPARIKRYFTNEENGYYRINNLIREMLVFAPQNVIKDPPFTKLDLLCCRNLLIYLGPELQRKILPAFHYSLNPDGLLMLGTSENIGQNTDLFTSLHRKWKIFRRKTMTTEKQRNVTTPALSDDYSAADIESLKSTKKSEERSALQLVETILQESDTPPCAIINDARNVIYIHGKTGRFMEPAEGRINYNIIDMARPSLKPALSSAIKEVSISQKDIVDRGLQVTSDTETYFVDITVKPVHDQTALQGHMMVVFEETNAPSKRQPKRPKQTKPKGKEKSAREIEQELHQTRENLQTTVEELETSNEELKSTNEELQSTNEELQSTNEELETSKEELQSLNEEAATVNTELQCRIDELTNLTDDMKNLLENTKLAIIFLDTDLQVRRFTSQATRIIPLTPGDCGRPIRDLASSLMDVDLEKLSKEVLRDLAVQEKKAYSDDGCCYTMRIRPYRTTANVIDGVVITFEDITELIRITDELQDAEYSRSLALQVGQIGSFDVDLETGKGSWSPELADIWGIPEDFADNFADLCWELIHKDDLERVKKEFALLVETRKISDMEFRIVRPDGTLRWVHWRGQVSQNSTDSGLRAVGVNQDITVRKLLQDETRRNDQLIKAAVKASPFKLIVAHIDTEARYKWIYNPHSDVPDEDIIGKRDDELSDDEGSLELLALKKKVLASGVESLQEITFHLPEGDCKYRVSVAPIFDEAGKVTGAATSSVEMPVAM